MWRKWRQVLTPLNVISTLPLLFAMLCGGYLSYRYNILLRENRDLVVHTYQVINAIDGLLIRLEDAETGQRGYIITGDASYLAPYEPGCRCDRRRHNPRGLGAESLNPIHIAVVNCGGRAC